MSDADTTDGYDETVLFPRWKRHARPRLQVVRVFLDAQGYLLFADKQRHYNNMFKHAWTNFVQQPHSLPDRKKRETFESYRHLAYYVIGAIHVKWDSRKAAPEITVFDAVDKVVHAFDESPLFFQVQGCPETRKRNGWIVFAQPKEEVLLSIQNTHKKRKIQLKSSLRKPLAPGSSLSSHRTRRSKGARVSIFGARDPLNKQSEQEFMNQKKSRVQNL